MADGKSPMINPVGSALAFLGMVGEARGEVFRTLARKIAISTALFILTMDLARGAVLKLFGVSLPVVQLAGGHVLAAMGLSLLNEKDVAGERAFIPGSGFVRFTGESFLPVHFSLDGWPRRTCGDAHTKRHASKGTLVQAIFAHLGVLCGMALMCLAVFASYAYAPKITEKIFPMTAHGILRVIAFVLFCIDVQIAWNGFNTLNKGHGLLLK